MIGIYCIENVKNLHRYVGQSIHVEVRKDEHFKALRRGEHFNQHLQNAFDKYGESCFRFYMLEECCESVLSDREIYWISKFGGHNSESLYNISPGGHVTNGEHNPNYGKHWSDDWKSAQSARMREYLKDPNNHPMYGKHHSQETVDKIRSSLSGRSQPDDLNQKRSKTMKRHFEAGMIPPMLGKHHSEETKAKLRITSSNYKHSVTTRKKISSALRGENNPMFGKTHTEETKRKMSRDRTGPGNNMYGKIRITDGIINKSWPKNEPLPEGFQKGMAPRKRKESK